MLNPPQLSRFLLQCRENNWVLFFISIRRHPEACLLFCYGTDSSFTSWLLLNWRSWSRRSTISKMVAGWIPDGVTGIFR